MFLLLLAHFVHCEMRGKVTELLARKKAAGRYRPAAANYGAFCFYAKTAAASRNV